MVDCSGTMILRVWEHLLNTQDSFILKELADILMYNTQRKQKQRLQKALDVLVRIGVVRKFNKEKLWYYVACFEGNHFSNTTSIELEEDIKKALQENPKPLLSSSSLDIQEDKQEDKMENIFNEVEDGI